jgi:prevent-host-death family protein
VFQVREIGAFEARNKLGQLLDRAEAGEEVVITRRGRVVARLVPPLLVIDRERAREAAAAIREMRKGVRLRPGS